MTVKVLLLSILSACLYRCGGSGWKYIGNTKYRDFGVPLCGLATYFLIGGIASWWAYILTFGAMFGVMTSYFKFGDQEDVYWYNWLITGFMYGISALPLAWGHWLGFGIRTGILAILVMFFSERIDEVNLEEGMRGFLFTATIPLLLIGG